MRPHAQPETLRQPNETESRLGVHDGESMDIEIFCPESFEKKRDVSQLYSYQAKPICQESLTPVFPIDKSEDSYCSIDSFNDPFESLGGERPETRQERNIRQGPSSRPVNAD